MGKHFWLKYRLNQRIDQPLFEGFNKRATETISRIHFNDFKTSNTVELHEHLELDVDERSCSGTCLREDVCLADFLGNSVGKDTKNGYSSCTSTDCVQEFADLFKSDYETLKSAGGLDGSKITDLDDYLDNIEKMGEFDHKMDQPFKSFISGLLDVTIIKPIIECGTGYDLITGEDLTSFERAMKGVFALVDIVTLGTAIAGTEGIELGGKETLILAGKTVAVNMGANAASYTVGYISNEVGAPLAITMLLSMGAGVTVSKVAGKYFFQSASGALLGDCNVPGESIDGLKVGSKATEVGVNAVEKVKNGEQFIKIDGKKALKSDVEYETSEEYKYITDTEGRISKVEANLKLGKADRNTYAQRVVGREDRLSNDDGGHLIARIFNGSGDLDNLVPMNSTLNRGEYKVLENTWKKALNEIPPKKVEIKIKPIYEGTSLRPVRFKIDYKIDGAKYSDILTN